MRKTLLFSITAFTIIIASCIAIHANLENKKTPPVLDTKKATSWFIREDVQESKNVTTTDGTQKNATYAGTNGKDENNPIDIYEDENQNQYRYNQDGDLVAYRAGLSETTTNSAESNNETFSTSSVENDHHTLTIPDDISVADQTILDFTWNYVCQTYNERINGFELLRFELRPGSAGYYVDFAKTYGANGFITGPLIANSLDLNGNLIYSAISDDLMTDFDASLVENLTQEQVYASVVPVFEEQNPGYAATPIEISSVKLVRQNDTFALQVVLKFQTALTDTEFCEVKDVCYYSLDPIA